MLWGTACSGEVLKKTVTLMVMMMIKVIISRMGTTMMA